MFAAGTNSGASTEGGVVGSWTDTSGNPVANGDGSVWYQAPGTTATHCFNGIDTNCTVIPSTTDISYFYDVTNAPMSQWSFGAGNPWSSICDGISFPVLTFQNITDPSRCK